MKNYFKALILLGFSGVAVHSAGDAAAGAGGNAAAAMINSLHANAIITKAEMAKEALSLELEAAVVFIVGKITEKLATHGIGLPDEWQEEFKRSIRLSFKLLLKEREVPLSQEKYVELFDGFIDALMGGALKEEDIVEKELKKVAAIFTNDALFDEEQNIKVDPLIAQFVEMYPWIAINRAGAGGPLISDYLRGMYTGEKRDVLLLNQQLITNWLTDLKHFSHPAIKELMKNVPVGMACRAMADLALVIWYAGRVNPEYSLPVSE